MRILVIDDTDTNLKAAEQTLGGHELTLVASYDEAHRLLQKPEGEMSPSFDVVLCDLFMPAGAVEQGSDGQKYVGQEMPVGFALALMAVLHGAKYVAVVTNLNHHQHPGAAMLDCLGAPTLGSHNKDEFVKIRANGVPIGFANDGPSVDVEGTSCVECGGVGTRVKHGRPVECYSCYDGKVKGKNWGSVLKYLLEN